MANNRDILKRALGLPEDVAPPGADGSVGAGAGFTPLGAAVNDPNSMSGLLRLLQAHAQAPIDAQEQGVRDTENDPTLKAAADTKYKEEMALAGEPNRVKGVGDLNVETLKAKTQTDQETARRAQVDQILQRQNGANGGSGGSGFKMSINAAGEPTFAPDAMPALVQRAHSQLLDARQKTQQALAEAERLYPGITAAAQHADQQPQAPGWSDILTGGAGKYGGLSDRAGALNDRAKYTLGFATPFSKLAQEASFGNIEQMAGQLPGVRGLATITPMFKEHQSRWGHETPLATVQRLMHMDGIMGDTLTNIEHGGGSTSSDGVDFQSPPTAAELAGGR